MEPQILAYFAEVVGIVGEVEETIEELRADLVIQIVGRQGFPKNNPCPRPWMWEKDDVK
jgi:hypothetical protein